MTPEERRSSKTLVYQCLPSRYGFNPDDVRNADAIEVVIGQGAKPGGGMLLGQKGFRDPEVYNMNREDKNHIAFGGGPHRCLGSHLARVEMQIITEVVLSRLQNIRLDPQHPPRYHGGHVIGPESLPLVWDVFATSTTPTNTR